MVASDQAPRVGVLALQGDVSEHLRALREAGAEPSEVRTLSELQSVDGLIIPGGESTTVGKLLARFELLDPLRERVREGMPIYGTCTGMILLARNIEDGLPDQPSLGLMDVTVKRNAFGRQRESFEADVDVKALDGGKFHGVFIRAPYITRCDKSAEVLAMHGEHIVAARQANMLATAFHPELTGDYRMHRYFVGMVAARQVGATPKNGKNGKSGKHAGRTASV
jgi:5'-phosphate synthase pdxT subunit